MPSTLHLGDCQNGCETCKKNYHEGKLLCEHGDLIL